MDETIENYFTKSSDLIYDVGWNIGWIQTGDQRKKIPSEYRLVGQIADSRYS